jgi:hypothetical protein
MHKQSLSTGIASTPERGTSCADGRRMVVDASFAVGEEAYLPHALPVAGVGDRGCLRGYTESVVFCAHARSRRQGAVL